VGVEVARSWAHLAGQWEKMSDCILLVSGSRALGILSILHLEVTSFGLAIFGSMLSWATADDNKTQSLLPSFRSNIGHNDKYFVSGIS
jgi:hypothetical protein